MNYQVTELHISQKDVYTDQLLNRESSHYNIGGYIQLKGPLDINRFREAVESAGLVFDAFHMRFDLNTADYKCYFPEIPEPLKVNYLDFSNSENPEQSALEWIQDRNNTRFDLVPENALYEQAILKLGENLHWFYGRYHHLIIDGYGFAVYVNYLADHYRSGSVNHAHSSYRSEVIKSNDYLNSGQYKEDKAYWLNRVSGKPARLLHKRAFQSAPGAAVNSTVIFKIPGDLRDTLKKSEILFSAGLQQLTLAALIIYFGKVSGKQDLVFSVPVHRRNSRRLRQMVGMFSGYIPFKGRFEPGQSAKELVRQINLSQRSDYRHQNYPIGDLSRDLKINPLDGYLHEIAVNYEPLGFHPDFGMDIHADVIRVANEADPNPLQVSWREYDGRNQMELHIHFLREYFDEGDIDLFYDRLIFIMHQLIENPDMKLRDFSVIPPGEMNLIRSFNETGFPLTGGKTVIDLFEEQVELIPDQIAVWHEDKALTYRELNEKVNSLANYLIRAGVKKGELVVILLERSFDMLISVLAVLKSGAAYVPVEPTYPTDRILFKLKDTNPCLLILDVRTIEKLSGKFEGNVIDASTFPVIFNKFPRNDPGVKVSPSDLAYIIYTSGSTGQPKGVMVEHQNMYSFICWALQEFDSEHVDIIYFVTSICFDLSIFEMFYPLCSGKSVRILKNGMQIPNYLDQDHNILINTVPSVIENLLKGGTNFTNVRSINMAGEPIGKYIQENLDFAKFRVRNLYGPTEDTTYSTVFRIKEGKEVLIGKPIHNTMVRIISEAGELQPLGEPGEIFLSGSGVARGYLNREELTTQKFLPDPFSEVPGIRMYKTGDLGYWMKDGNIQFLGRMDDQVKIRGYRVELGEIESVIYQSGMVLKAVVLAKFENGSKRLIGFIVPGENFNNHLLIDFIKSRLPDFMVPSQLVEMDEIPLTSNGKVDKLALSKLETGEKLNARYQPPRNQREEKLCLIWQNLLNIKKVGIDDNFFEIGGHSINALQFTSRLYKELEIKADLTMIMRFPTIRQFSEALDHGIREDYGDIPRLPLAEHYPLSHAQKRYWVMSHYKGGTSAYNESSVYTIEKNLRMDAFRKAMDAILERHEILRSVFPEVNGEPFQKVLSLEQYNFRVIEKDLRYHQDSETYIKKWIHEDSHKAFDLTNGPLLRVSLFRTDLAKYTLVFNIHHIISDGWSKGIFIREFLHFYKAFTIGTKKNLPPLPLQYRDYAVWHKQIFHTQMTYWQSVLGRGIPVLNFPTDYIRPDVVHFDGEAEHSRISVSLTRDLKNMAIINNMSLNNLLISLYGAYLAAYTGQNDIIVGTVSSGRSHMDLENLIGVFINFLPVRIYIDKSIKLDGFLSESAEKLARVYQNQDYPFDLMVDEFVKSRDVSRNPIFDTMINFQIDNDLLSNGDFWEKQFSETGIVIRQDQELQEVMFQSMVDFKLDVVPADQMLNFHLTYNKGLFTRERMHIFLNGFVNFLNNVVQNPCESLEDYGVWKNEPVRQTDADKKDDHTEDVVIVSTFVAEPVGDYISYWGNELDLGLNVKFAAYNQVFQQLLDSDSLIRKNRGINVIMIRMVDWIRDRDNSDVDQVIVFLKQTLNELISALESVSAHSPARFLFGLFPVPDRSSHYEKIVECIDELTGTLEDFIRNISRFHLLDLDRMARLYDIQEHYDPSADLAGHMPFTPEYYATLGTWISRQIHSLKSNAYKVIALDCDNTLWRGICGEAGPNGVLIDENHRALQAFMVEKYHEGFLIVLNSKNNEQDVWDVFSGNPDMILQKQHITSWRINWEPKSDNMVSLAGELNLGLSGFIFIDDNAFETEQMSLALPEVLSLQLPEDPSEFKGYLEHIWAFDNFRVTEEDLNRNQMYQTETMRRHESEKYQTYEDFLNSLNIQVTSSPLEESDLDRAVQLLLRTNQFNLNGIRKTEQEVRAAMAESDSLNWIIEVSDRFGDYGKVGLIMAKPTGNTLKVDTFLLSCRVLGRTVENILLDRLKDYCKTLGLVSLVAEYRETPKNMPFSEFLKGNGWYLQEQSGKYIMNLEGVEGSNLARQ